MHSRRAVRLRSAPLTSARSSAGLGCGAVKGRMKDAIRRFRLALLKVQEQIESRVALS